MQFLIQFTKFGINHINNNSNYQNIKHPSRNFSSTNTANKNAEENQTW